MIHRAQLLSDLQVLVRKLEADLQERVDAPEVPEVKQKLRSQYEAAKQAERTAQTFNQWVSDQQTQVAVAWVLSATFARFLEDNELVSPPRISGEPLQRARDEYEAYFRENPTYTDREYLLWVFEQLAVLPGAREIFGEGNLIGDIPNWLSGDAAGEIVGFFQAVNPDTGTLVHDFADPDWNTRFLGDLYQDLSEAARKKYALLQTPSFVEEFILDRTLEPAIEQFGLGTVRLIDPACGSGHFLLGAFERLMDRWPRREPGTSLVVLAQRALDAVHGVDVNPFAVAIARFRLLLAAMKATGQRRLRDARAFTLNVACGDSLLHGEGSQLVLGDWAPMAHHFVGEDIAALNRILRRGHYHAVVANPPYIVPRDKALNGEYRQRYEVCYRQYSLAVPFMERIFQLAVPGGFTGQITANSFMKREFGKKLIEDFFPKVDLTHVIDTSGAYIPGHGTPTVILFGRNRAPISSKIRTVMGIRGEPSTPDDPTQGLVWSAILEQIDVEGSESEFVSVTDSQRDLFHRHPWSIGGGGATKLKKMLNEVCDIQLSQLIDSIGFFQDNHADSVFVQPKGFAERHNLKYAFKEQVRGNNIRDWNKKSEEEIFFPYYENLDQWRAIPSESRWSWLINVRTELWSRSTFGGGTYKTSGRPWFDYHQFPKERARFPLSIAFAFVATHNHFVLDRGGKVFNRSAPVIKLPATATEDDHLALLGLLNSSTACFWMKQVMTNKGNGGIGGGIGDEQWEPRYEIDGTKLKTFPIPSNMPKMLAGIIYGAASILGERSFDHVFKLTSPDQSLVTDLVKTQHEISTHIISLQEELDWQYYQVYSLSDDSFVYQGEVPNIQLGQRAFEIIMARKMATGELETTWFDRHRSTPITKLPDHWPDDYKQLVERRIKLIETDKSIGLIEQPEYKRRWNTEPWESQLERALQGWLLNRLEEYFDFDGRMNPQAQACKISDPALISTVKLADIARQDAEFMQVGELYTQDPAFDVLTLINTLVTAEAVPLLPSLRYKPSGLRKYQDWQHTWHLQRQEDAIDARNQLPKDHPDYLDSSAADRLKAQEIGPIPVPPKYKNSDFQKPHYWKLRGKLDVPKERWVSFPHCEGPDGQPVIAWAGYDHLQLALALSTYFVYIKEEIGGSEDPRLTPLLGGLIELLPWLKQWHNDLDPTYGLQMGDYIQGFIDDELRQLNQTAASIQTWEPPKLKTKRKRK